MLQAWVYWQRCQRSDLWSPLLAPSPGMQLERTPGVQLSNESLPAQCLPGDPLGLEMRTVYQAVIRMALSFLQDFPASLGPTSTAWLWEGLDSEACSGVGPILVPTRASEEAGTQPQHTAARALPRGGSDFLQWPGTAVQPSHRDSGVSGDREGPQPPPGPRLLLPASPAPPCALTFSLNCKGRFQLSPQEVEASSGPDGTGFRRGC